MRIKNNKGDASFKVMLFSLAVFIILCAALYSRLDIAEIRRESGTDIATGTQDEIGNLLTGLKKQQENTSKEAAVQNENRTTSLTTTPDTVEGVVVEKEGENEGEANAPQEPTSNALGSHEGRFYFDKLKQDEKTVYCQIYDAIMTRTEMTLSTLDEDLADRLYQFVLWDHPEIFDTRGYQMVKHTFNDVVKKLTISAVYEMTPRQQAANQQQIDIYVNTFMASVPAGLDTYGKIKYVFDYIVNHTEYELGSPDSQNICSVMVGHKSVCAGYAKATQYLLSKLSIPATIVHGKVGTEGHAWNLVYVDGQPYYLDTTWGDSSYNFQDYDEGVNRRPPEANYDYFLITEQELKMTHTIDEPQYYPSVTATENNYYRREGKYFTVYDTELFKQCVDQAYEQGKATLTVRVADDALLSEMRQKLIDEQEIFHYLRGVESLYYSINENMRTMTFWL